MPRLGAQYRAPLSILTIALLFAIPGRFAYGADDAPVPPPAFADPDPNGQQVVADILAKLRAAPRDQKESIAGDLAALGERYFVALTKALSAKRVSTNADMRSALVAINADLPGADGTFKLKRAEKRGDDDSAPTEPDWLKSLAALPENHTHHAAVLDAMETVALIRAITATDDPRAVELLLDWSFSESGNAFRDEVGRQIRAMSDPALPGLVWVTRGRDKKFDKVARYANYQLDRMDRQRPVRAIGSVDDQTRIELLRMYGKTRHPDAVLAVLSLVDSPNTRLRKMAHWALLRYVVGPPPPPAPRRHMKLPGGELSTETKPLYFTYREIAEIELAKTLVARGEPQPAADTTGEEMAKKLIAKIDGEQTRVRNERLADAQSKRAKGDVAAAVATYDALLADDPLMEGRSNMAAGYLEHGNVLKSAGKYEEAALSFDKALSVTADSNQAKEAEAELAYARGMAAKAKGEKRPEEFRRTLALKPDHEGAQAELRELVRNEKSHRSRWMLALALGAGVAGLLVLILRLFRRG